MKIFLDGFSSEGINRVVHWVNGIFKNKLGIFGGLYQESFTPPTEGQVAPFRITNGRGAHTNLRNSSGTEIGSYTGAGIGGPNKLGVSVAGVLVAANFFAQGSMAGTSLTGSYQTLLTVTKCAILFLTNNTDKAVKFSTDAASTNFELDPYEKISIDFYANWEFFTGTVSIKHSGVAPTTGTVRAMVALGPTGE